MKKLFIIILLCLCSKAKSQDNRWVFLSKSADGRKYLIDTLSADIKQLSSYDNHYSVVVLWMIISKKTYLKKSPHQLERKYRLAIDTAKNQYEIKYYIKYLDGEPLISEPHNEIDWVDVIPDTMAEDVLKYVKSLQ